MKINQLKEILKEVVREVVREEVRNILREEINPSPIPQSTKSFKPTSKPLPPKKIKSTGDPIQDLLNETAQAGEWRTMGNYTSANAQSFMGQHMNNFISEPQVTNVESFIDNSKNQVGLHHHQIQVNEVPDFSNMVNVMKSKGML
jgi:hypothetical protein